MSLPHKNFNYYKGKHDMNKIKLTKKNQNVKIEMNKIEKKYF